MKRDRLTVAEEELMNIFWSKEEPLTSIALLELSADKSWSGNYLHKMLRSLQKKEYIRVCGTVQAGKQYARQFISTVKKEEYAAYLLALQGLSTSSFAKIAVELVKGDESQKSKEENEALIRELEEMIQQLRNMGEE